MKEQIINSIKNNLASYPGLLNVTLVGSHADPSKKLEAKNDLDFIFIFDELRPANYTDFKSKLVDMAAKLDTPEHAVWAEFRVGPIKPICPRPADTCTMIHALVFDSASFQNYIKIAPLITNNWSPYPALLGKNLTEMFTFHWPTPEDFLNAPRHSITYYLGSLKDKVFIYVSMVEKDGKLVMETERQPMTEQQFIEVCSDVLNKNMVHAVNVYQKENGQVDKKVVVNKFLQIFPEFSNQDAELRAINDLKQKLRAGEASPYQASELEKKLEDFLLKLAELVKNKPA